MKARRRTAPPLARCARRPCASLLESLARSGLPTRRDRRVRRLGWQAGVAEAVDDRVAPVAAEILWPDLDARRRLPALVFGEIEELFDSAHRVRVVALRDDVGDPHLLLDQTVENAVKNGVRRQRILVFLVLAQFRARRLGEDVLGDHLPVRPERPDRLPAVAERAEAEDFHLVEVLD